MVPNIFYITCRKYDMGVIKKLMGIFRTTGKCSLHYLKVRGYVDGPCVNYNGVDCSVAYKSGNSYLVALKPIPTMTGFEHKIVDITVEPVLEFLRPEDLHTILKNTEMMESYKTTSSAVKLKFTHDEYVFAISYAGNEMELFESLRKYGVMWSDVDVIVDGDDHYLSFDKTFGANFQELDYEISFDEYDDGVDDNMMVLSLGENGGRNEGNEKNEEEDYPYHDDYEEDYTYLYNYEGEFQNY